MMLKLTMIRHGKTEGNSLGRYIGVTDEPLLEEERRELQGLAFDYAEAVYSSPMKRCLETAAILFPDLEPVVIPELAECDFGRFEGKTYQELYEDPAYREWVESGEIEAFPGGERRADFQERCIRGFEKIIADAVRRRKNSIALIVHGGTIMSILDAYGFPGQSYNDWYVGNGEGYQVRLNPDLFTEQNDSEREIIVDRKIIRDER